MKSVNYFLIVLLILIVGCSNERINDSLEKDIYEQNGYELRLIKGEFPIKFDFEDEWLEIPKGTEKNIEETVFEKGNSTVMIKSIEHNTDGNLDLILDIKHEFNEKSGRFLSNIKYNEDGSISYYERSNTRQWEFTDTDGRKIEVIDIMGQSGAGPNQSIHVELKVSELDRTLKSIQFNLYLYEYQKVNLN